MVINTMNMKLCILNTAGNHINSAIDIDEQELAKIMFERTVTYNEKDYAILNFRFEGHNILLQTNAPISELDMFPHGRKKLSYSSKIMYINDDGVMVYCLNNSPVKPDTVEKQPFILPGVYDGLWSGYNLVIIFTNGMKCDPIRTINGVRGINCATKVIVMPDGTVFLD